MKKSEAEKGVTLPAAIFWEDKPQHKSPAWQEEVWMCHHTCQVPITAVPQVKYDQEGLPQIVQTFRKRRNPFTTKSRTKTASVGLRKQQNLKKRPKTNQKTSGFTTQRLQLVQLSVFPVRHVSPDGRTDRCWPVGTWRDELWRPHVRLQSTSITLDRPTWCPGWRRRSGVDIVTPTRVSVWARQNRRFNFNYKYGRVSKKCQNQSNQ